MPKEEITYYERKLGGANMDKDSLEPILLDYLKRAVSDLKVDFGSLVILDKERKIISMARIGEFRFDGKFSEYSQEEFIFSMKEGEPVIRNREVKQSFLSFRRRKIKSEMIIPLELKDGKTVIFFFPSFEKGYFRETHVKSAKEIFEEIKFKIEREYFHNKKNLILYNCKTSESIIKNLLGNEFSIISISHPAQIKNKNINDRGFLITECPSKCSLECGKIFSLLNENRIPFGILRPVDLKRSGEFSLFCTYYSPSFSSPIPEKIKKVFSSLKNILYSKISPNEKRILEVLSFFEKESIEDQLSNFKASDLAKLTNISRPFFSKEFKEITGKSIKEFMNQVKMCTSLYYLSSGKSVKIVSYLLGYKSRTYFIDKFKKYFGVCPSYFKMNTK